jgi:hypothetical protein
LLGHPLFCLQDGIGRGVTATRRALVILCGVNNFQKLLWK